MYWLAHQEGLIANGSVHAGLRTRLAGPDDNTLDDAQGWHRIASDDIAPDRLGPAGVSSAILDAIGTDRPVYLSVDVRIAVFRSVL